MTHLHTFRHAARKYVALAAIILLVSSALAQAPTDDEASTAMAQGLNKYPGLLPEFGRLVQKIQQEVVFPAPRTDSQLLPLLPKSTIFYGALPNYGEASHQILTIFQRELQQSAVLRNWWQTASKDGANVERYVDEYYQLSRYLGDELVVSGAIDGARDPKLLIVAEVRKPGLKDFLERSVRTLDPKSEQEISILDARELAAAQSKTIAPKFFILVRSDLVIASPDLPTLKAFNAQLNRKTREFAATPFAQRMAQAYHDGVTTLGGADLQSIIRQIPFESEQAPTIFRKTGFADAQYLVWKHKPVAGLSTSQMELSFLGPRHGIASWLAAPGPMGSLEFASPKAVFLTTALLKNPEEIYDDVRNLANISNPNAFVSVEQMEKGLKLSLRQDLLSLLGGEITLEVDSITPEPAWKVILKVKDADRLQSTLNRLLATLPVRPQQFEQQGLTYHTLQIPSGQKTQEFGYVFVDGYLVLASSRETLADAVRFHREGGSLAKSSKFLAALPPGSLSEMSAFFYEDPLAIAALSLQRNPALAQIFSQSASQSVPVVLGAYGEENAIRYASRSNGLDAGAIMVVAAIAVPNLLRARIAANEATAAGMIRTIDTAQISYSVAFPDRGYARSLAMLGVNTLNDVPSPDHGAFLDATLGNDACTAGAWCIKSGFRFTMTAVCKAGKCEDYVAVGTPVSTSTGSRNFCSTSDGLVRVNPGPPLKVPISVSTCQAWKPLH
jgi:type IV pilus assembly protein PilA